MSNKDSVMHGDKYFEQESTAVWTYDNVELSYVRHIDKSIQNAGKWRSRLPDQATVQSIIPGAEIDGKIVPSPPESEMLRGFSGIAFRHFMNNLCSMEGANYLEVGTFRGSSLVSAVFGNTQILNEIHAIDNFSEFIIEESGFHPRDDLEKNLSLFLGDEKERVNFHEEDCFSFDLDRLPKIGIYFYDGEHSRENQMKAFTYFEPVFDDIFIAVVDDWEQRQVRLGTLDAFEKINYDVVASRCVIPGRREDNANRVNNPTFDWWNGTYIAVLKKRK